MKISGVDIKLFGLYCAMSISLTKWLFSVMTRVADAVPHDAWVVEMVFCHGHALRELWSL